MKVYVLGPDLDARGMTDRLIEGVTSVDYGGFVDLVRQQAATAQQGRAESGADDYDGNERPEECRYTTHGENLA